MNQLILPPFSIPFHPLCRSRLPTLSVIFLSLALFLENQTQTYSEYDLVRFNATCARTSGTRPHPCTLLVDFFLTEGQAAAFSERLSLTKDERSLLLFLVKCRDQSGRQVPTMFQQVEDLNTLKMYERRIIGDQWPPGKSLKVRDQVNFFHLLLGTPLFETLTVLRVFSLVYDPIRNKTYVGMYLFAVLIIPLFVFCFPDLGAF